MRRALLLLLLLPVWVAVAAQAGEIKTYTIEDVLKQAREKNPSLPEFDANLKAAEGELAAAGAFPNPVLEIELGRGRATREENLDRREYRFSVEQPLETAAKRRFRRDAAQASLVSTRTELDDFRLLLTFEVKVAFYRLLLAHKTLEVTGQNRGALEEAVRKIALRVEAGDAAEVDLIKARVELLKAERDFRVAARKIEGLKAALDALCGGAFGRDFTVAGSLDNELPAIEPGLITEKALSRHPLIERRKKEVEREEALLGYERASRLGDFSFRAFYGQEIDKELYGAGLSVPLPLWNRRDGEISAAGARLACARAGLGQARLKVAAEISQALAEAEAAAEQVKAFEQGILENARDVQATAAFAYEQGETSLLEMLDAQRVHAATLLEYQEAIHDLSTAIARLERASGGNIHD